MKETVGLEGLEGLAPIVAPLTAAEETRNTRLEKTALDAGRAWATSYCAALSVEGRRLEGGWPGTMPEARTRALATVSIMLAERSMARLTHQEGGRIARITYDEARRCWRSMSDGRRSASCEDE